VVGLYAEADIKQVGLELLTSPCDHKGFLFYLSIVLLCGGQCS